MDANRFDALTKFLATRFSRRAVAQRSAGGLAVATLLGAGARGAAAQGATPVATPQATPAASGEKISLLFVQSFNAGSFIPNAQESGTYMLTLKDAGGQTVYFSDRPERIVGTMPTAKFVDGRAFDPSDPPNAAIVAQTDAGEDTLIIELTSPRYDGTARQLTYDARVLSNTTDEWLAAMVLKPNDDKIAEQLGPGSLFVDQLTCSPDGVSCDSNSDCCSGFCCDDIEICPPGVCTPT